MLDIYTLYFDGACGPRNPGGTAAYGYTLHKFAELIDRGDGLVGSGPEMSCNVAEYAGLHAGLLTFSKVVSPNVGRNPPTPNRTWLQVRGDSQLVINQMSGKWRAKSGLYYPYYEKAEAACSDLRKLGIKLSFDWIPREMNTECDTLSKAPLGGRGGGV